MDLEDGRVKEMGQMDNGGWWVVDWSTILNGVKEGRDRTEILENRGERDGTGKGEGSTER